MGLLDELSEESTWNEFIEHKVTHQHLTNSEKNDLIKFVQEKEYLKITDRFKEKDYCFEPPVKRYISKKGTAKKRVVYCFSREEQMVMKCMAHLLYRYDSFMADSCYSFRKSKSAKDAIRKAVCHDHSKMTGLKIDISNYFNSIPTEPLCKILEGIMGEDDPELFSFLMKILTLDLAYEERRSGEPVHEKHGAMAGIPIAPFLANVYLKELDLHFESKGIPYFRYSDDILIFVRSREEAENDLAFLEAYLSERGLSINQEKVKIYEPGEGWEFLGVSYKNGKIDLSYMTKKKLKAKIRRKARAFYRWRMRNNVSYDKTAGAFIRLFNSKFYQKKDEKNFTWSRWFFPIITTDEGLKEIDDYFVEYIRYLRSGRHYKGNYCISYEEIKELGYRSLVHEYWKYRKEDEEKEKKKNSEFVLAP